jgi:hypothetical protein
MTRFWIEHLATGEIVGAQAAPDSITPTASRGGAFMLEVNNIYDPQTSVLLAGVVVSKGAQPSPFHIYDYEEHEWVDARTINDYKAAQWNKIKRARDSTEFGGFEYGGNIFDSDSMSQSRLQGAIQLANIALSMGQDFEINWTLQDNSVIVLTHTELITVALALGNHVAAAHEKARDLRLEIEAALTKEEVEAIVW